MDRQQAAKIYKSVLIDRTRTDVPADVAEALDVAVQTLGDDRDSLQRALVESRAEIVELVNVITQMRSAQCGCLGGLGSEYAL